jgi:tetratricopeptide (TPR) repeat protein
VLAALLLSIGISSADAQQREGDAAWAAGSFEDARAAYLELLSQDPRDVRANLRLGIILSWQGQLDSSLVYLGRARAEDPADVEIRLIQARVLAWSKRYTAALARYDSVLTEQPDLHEALMGRARTLAWAGRFEEAQALYRPMLAHDSTDHEALLGAAQVTAWKGDLGQAEQQYRRMLAADPRDLEARVGLGYVYLWQDRVSASGREAKYALGIDSTARSARELWNKVREANSSPLETSANWTNDSDDNTSFSQTVGASAPLVERLRVFGSVNALQASDPVREGERVGVEAGATMTLREFQLSGAGGARRLTPDVASPRTAGTYRGRVSYRPVSTLGLSLGYSRAPFDETAALIEQGLDIESLDAGMDLQPSRGLKIFGEAGSWWLSDGNYRSNFSAGFTQKLYHGSFVGLFGRTLSYDSRGTGYFSPDRFTVAEGLAGYDHQSRRWSASAAGGLGAQQVGADAAAQIEWHIEARVGPHWENGSRIELFGLFTNSAVSSTTGAFRSGSAGLSARLSL